MFGSREYPITGVFYFGLKQIYLGISITFPIHCFPIRCHMNPILPSQILTSKTLKRHHFLLSSTPVFLLFIQVACRVGALRWLGTRENQTTSRLGKGMSGPLLAQRVKG
ncbi:hypothetical protein Goshw_025257, partial [Gossypium schwendimanii]|nr:hypothetical protein [Gossypium schwendimanii]